MKILVMANTSFYLANFRAALLDQLVAQGHEITIYCPRTSDAKSEAFLPKYRCIHPPEYLWTNPVLWPLALVHLIWSLREWKCQSILTFTIQANILGGAYSRFLRTQFFPGISGLGTAFLGAKIRTKVATALLRFSCKDASCIFFENEDDRSTFIRLGIVSGDSLVTNGAGVDTDKFVPNADAEFGEHTTFLMIARITKEKGVIEFVQACKQIKKEFPDATCQLIGDFYPNNPSSISPEYFAELNSENQVDYLGFKQEVLPYIQKATCIVLPSYREGTSGVLLEAIACAKPAITSDCPGCNNVIQHKVNGLLVPPRSAEELYLAMVEFIKMPNDARDAMGLKGRELAQQNFDQKVINSKILTRLNCIQPSN